MTEQTDEVDRHHQPRGRRWRGQPARQRPQAGDRDQGRQGQGDKLARGSDARYMLSVDADSVGRSRGQRQGRRRARPHSARERQDARHHRRSAAGGGAVRGAPAEGPCDHRRDLGPGRVRPRLQEQAADPHRAERRVAGAGRISHPEGQASAGPGRGFHREGRVHPRRQSGAARHPGDQGRGGRLPPTSSTRSRRSTGCRACRSTTSISR